MSQSTYNFRLVGHQRIVEFVGIPVSPPVTPQSKVFATVAEWNGNQTFVGGARIYLCNLSATDGGVNIWVQADWDNDLAINVDLLIIN